MEMVWHTMRTILHDLSFYNENKTMPIHTLDRPAATLQTIKKKLGTENLYCVSLYSAILSM